MRNSISILVGCLSAMFFAACSNPLDYNTSVMKEVENVEDADVKIYDQILSGNVPSLENVLQEGEEQAALSLEKMKRLSDFRGDDSLKTAAIVYLSFYEDLFKNEYEDALQILKSSKTTQENADRLRELTADAPGRKMDAKRKFVSVHFKFVTKNGLVPVRKGDIFDN